MTDNFLDHAVHSIHPSAADMAAFKACADGAATGFGDGCVVVDSGFSCTNAVPYVMSRHSLPTPSACVHIHLVLHHLVYALLLHASRYPRRCHTRGIFFGVLPRRYAWTCAKKKIHVRVRVGVGVGVRLCVLCGDAESN
jgi:hypothetical protein